MRVSMININPDAALVSPAGAAAVRPDATVLQAASLGVDDLLPAPAYSSVRQAHRQSLIAYRRARTVALGSCVRLQFEDLLTVGYQIQEVLRAECIDSAEGIQREIDTYAHLVPDSSHWTATLFIELPDAAERQRLLPQLSLAAHRVYVEVGSLRTTAFANEDLAGSRNAGHLERPSGVHFLRFALPDAMRTALRAGAGATLGCASKQYPWRQPIPAALLRRLCGDSRRMADAVGCGTECACGVAPKREPAPAFTSSPAEPVERNLA